MPVKTKALLAIFVAAILWASAGAVAKLLFVHAGPFVAAFYRFGIASLIMMPFFVKEKISLRAIRALLPLGIFNALNILFYYSGIALTTANAAIILGTAVPITTVLLSYLLIHETVTKEKLIGIGIGLVGALFIVLLPLLEKGVAISGNLIGNLLLVGSLISWSLYIVYSRHILSKGEYSPVVSTSVNFFTSTAFAAVAAIVAHQSFVVPAIFTFSYLGVLLFAAIGITVITFFLFQWGVQYVSASTASLKEYIQLIGGVGINALVLGERLSASYIVGTVLIVLGVIIATGQQVSKKFAAILFSLGD